jgi:DNA-binding response OmpR family regulator
VRVLIAEDDVDLLDVSSYALRKFGYDVIAVTDGVSALERWRKDQPDLVLLDVNLPLRSGLDVCRDIRRESNAPIIMMSAVGDEPHVIEGFECGADDYIRKPLSYRELAMRMRVVLQRHSPVTTMESSTVATQGDLSVDQSNCEARRGGELIRLTRLEARALYFLVSNAGHVVPTERLIQLVWNFEGGDPFSLKTHISHLRQKLGVSKGEPGYISAVPQVGYRFETAS